MERDREMAKRKGKRKEDCMIDVRFFVFLRIQDWRLVMVMVMVIWDRGACERLCRVRMIGV